MDRAPGERHGAARLRRSARVAARRAYVALAASPLRPALELGPVRAARRRLGRRLGAGDLLDVLALLRTAGVRVWIAGGWGVDALLGEQTRLHNDLDLLVEEGEAAAAARAALLRAGFRPAPDDSPHAVRHVPGSPMPSREVLQDAEGRSVDLHPIDVGRWEVLVAPRAPFATGLVGGEEVPCLSAAAQAAAHSGYEVRDEHRRDVAHIRRLLDGGDERRGVVTNRPSSNAGPAGPARRAAARLVAGPATALLVPVLGLPADLAPAGPLPPHVTVLFPFARRRLAGGALVAELRDVFAGFSPFDFALTEVRRFPGVLYLAPEPAAPFVALTEACVRRWPALRPYGGAYPDVIPHLTLAEGPEPPGLAERAAAALPLHGRAEEVWLMERYLRRRWRRRATVPLG